MTKARTAEEWLVEMESGRSRLAAMKADLANGTDEATTAHDHGFLIAGDLGLAQVIR